MQALLLMSHNSARYVRRTAWLGRGCLRLHSRGTGKLSRRTGCSFNTLEVGAKFGGRLASQVGILFQAFQDDFAELRRQHGIQICR